MTTRLADPVAVLGFGNQGAAHAENLRDAGVRVVVGARAGHAAERRATQAGFEVRDLAGAVRGARVAVVLLPDEAVPGAWPALAGALEPGMALVFAHGFNLHFGALALPAGCDVVLVSPTAPGRVLRAARVRGERLPAYIAVHRDASGHARETAEAYADAIGLSPLWPTTVREETEVDLFGEQAVLCGGLNALVTAAFETLVGRGYSPEMSYLECVHQLRYLAELLHDRGPAAFRDAISGTARYGDLTRGPRVIGAASRGEMEAILDEIRSGAFAREWTAEVEAGLPRVSALIQAAREHPIEEARRRALGASPTPPVNRATPAPKTD